MIVIPLFLHLEHSEAMDRSLWDLGAAWKSAGDGVTDASMRRNRLIFG